MILKELPKTSKETCKIDEMLCDCVKKMQRSKDAILFLCSNNDLFYLIIFAMTLIYFFR